MDPVSAIAAGIGGIGSLIGGVVGSNAAGDAASIQQRNAQQVAQMLQGAGQQAQQIEGNALGTSNQLIQGGATGANQTLADFLQQELGNLNPYLQAGQQGLTQLTSLTAPGGDLTKQFQAPTEAEAAATPGFQFALDQGTQAINRSAAATGLSGGTLKALTQYGQGLASTTYQQSYNNALQTYNTNRQATMQNLGALLGAGQYGTSAAQGALQNAGNTMAANLAQSGYGQSANTMAAGAYQGNAVQNAAALAGNALTQGANAQAAGTIGSANAWQGAIGGLTNAAQFYSLSSLLNPTQGYPGGFTPYSQGNPFSLYPAIPTTAPVVPYNSGPIPTLPSGLGGIPSAPLYNQSGYQQGYW